MPPQPLLLPEITQINMHICYPLLIWFMHPKKILIWFRFETHYRFWTQDCPLQYIMGQIYYYSFLWIDPNPLIGIHKLWQCSWFNQKKCLTVYRVFFEWLKGKIYIYHHLFSGAIYLTSILGIVGPNQDLLLGPHRGWAWYLSLHSIMCRAREHLSHILQLLKQGNKGELFLTQSTQNETKSHFQTNTLILTVLLDLIQC